VKKETTIQLKWDRGFVRPISSKNRVVNLWLESILKYPPEMWQHFCRYCEELISEDWPKLMGNLSFENVLPLIISLEESDSESDWDFDTGNDDSEFSNEIMEVEEFCSFLSWTMGV
jgi:hypothetical protein